MKKILFLLILITLSFSVSAMQFNEGQQYIKLDKPITGEPQILEFFSFYCPHCYQFEYIYQISTMIKKVIPNNIKITKYHIDFLGSMGKELTHAWAVAIALGVKDKVSPLLFDGIQKTKKIQSLNDIREIFIKLGISAKDYDLAWNSFFVKTLIIRQEKAAINLKLRGVPAVFINGKYMVKNDGLDMSSVKIYAKQFADVVNFLLNKK